MSSNKGAREAGRTGGRAGRGQAGRWWSVVLGLTLAAVGTCAGCQEYCGTIAIATGATVGTAYLAGRPAHEIEQTYYLGVFDPQDQVPPTIYRVRVRGQASAMNATKFASGWVPANVADSLGTRLAFENEGGRVQMEKSDDLMPSQLKTGRRLMLFGPEGFREAPKNHRLVVIMGSDPQEYFKAVNEVLGSVSLGMREKRNSRLQSLLMGALVQAQGQRRQLDDVLVDAQTLHARQEGAK